MRLEHWFYTIPLRMRSLFRRSQMEGELEEELQLHLAQQIEKEIALGRTPDEARYAALRAMEGIEQRKEECRDARRVHWFDDLLQDARYALRLLTRSPGFTIVAALVLALGIGANSAVFTIVNAVLLQPLPFNEPGRLFLISCMPTNNPFILPGPYMSDRDYVAFRQQDYVFEHMATFSKETITMTGAGDPMVVNALSVTPDFFAVLRAHPAMGRVFLPEGQTEQNVALLSDRLWHSRFGGDPAIAGKAITLDGVSYTLLGVMPPGFAFQNAELWKRMEVQINPRNSFMLPVIGRLKPGISPMQAQAELEAFAARRPLGTEEKRENFVAHLLPLRELFVADVRKLLLIFAGAVAFVFLIACANFANLLLIRATSRQQEIAVRAALGASRWRLVRQLLAESTLLSLVGGALGVLLSIAGVRALLALLPPGRLPRIEQVHFDGWVLAFTFGLSLVTGLVFGLAPALNATRRELREAVSEGGRSVTARHERLRSALAMAEIALALVLLTGAGLLVRSFLRMRSVNPGFRSTNILTVTVDLPESRYRTAAQMRAFDERTLERLSALPEAESVAVVDWLPLRPEFVRGDFQLEDGRHLPRGFLVDKPVVNPGYFHTMGIPLLSGREFSERDNSTASGVAIISESVARRLWPGGDAMGKRISMEDNPKPGDWLTIIGVVRDVRQQSLTEVSSASVYQTYRQVNQPFFLSHMSFVVQTRDNPLTMASKIRTVLHQIDQALPSESIATMEAIIADTIMEARSQTRLLGLFSIMALLLAAIGIYGVLACSVAERTHEIGIRMAMGAEETDVLWMVLRRTLLLAGSGVLIGTLGALALTRVLSKFLFEITPTDPFTFLAVTAILVTVAIIAAWIPAQRAARVYPLVALRYE
jgi:putative ABC transport system permease protein